MDGNCAFLPIFGACFSPWVAADLNKERVVYLDIKAGFLISYRRRLVLKLCSFGYVRTFFCF